MDLSARQIVAAAQVVEEHDPGEVSLELKGGPGGLPPIYLHFGLADGRHRVLISWFGDVSSHQVTTVTELVS